MIKFLRIICFAQILLLSNVIMAQTDSSKAEIQKEAIQMRATVNKYLSDQLLTNDVGGKGDVKLAVIDSIANIIAQQKAELEMLKLSLQGIEKVVNEVKKQQIVSESSDIFLSGVKRLEENQLELYFPFDVYSLSNSQIIALNKFLSNRKIEKIQLTGYSDWVGTEKYNKRLAKRRGLNVKQNIHSSGKITLSNPVVSAETNSKDASYFRKVVVVIN
jgi:outer membrane protein OmpA-like peptidoglycan-associated protein